MFWSMAGLADPESLQRHAAEHLQFIRDTMARASGFTAVPGWGGALMGATAIGTAAAAPPVDDPAWLVWWLADAVAAVVIGIVSIVRKARRVGAPLQGGAARRFALALTPALVAAAILTVVLVGHGLTTVLPGCWLLLYGAAIASGGALSVRLVPLLGLCLMALGGIALMAPASWGNLFMGAGFGMTQVIFGCLIARRYGG
jgi:hypothetical protein